jgi:hypothetical protein
MVAAIRVISWEFWRENRFWIGCTVLGLVAAAMAFGSGRGPALAVERIMFLVVTLFESIGVTAGLGSRLMSKNRKGLSFVRALYVRPVPTWLLVTVRYTLALGTALAIHTLIVVLAQWFWGFQWPWLVSTLFILVSVACFHMLAWGLSGAPLLQLIGGCLVIALMGSWYGAVFPHPHVMEEPVAWGRLTLTQVAGMLLIIGSALGVCLLGVTSDRCGSRISFRWIQAWLGRLSARRSIKRKRFLSMTTAHLWYMLRCQGWLYIRVNLVLMATLCVFHQLTIIPDTMMPSMLAMIGMGNLFILPLSVGIPANTQRGGTLDPFVGARPISNRHLLGIYGLMAFLLLMTAWTTFLGGAVGIWAWFTVTGQEAVATELVEMVRNLWGPKSFSRDPHLFVIAWAVISLWSTMGVIGSLMLTGRRWLIGTVWFSFCFSVTGYMLLRKFGFPSEDMVATMDMLEKMDMDVRGFLGVLFASGTVVAFTVALYKRIIGSKCVMAAALAYPILAWFGGLYEFDWDYGVEILVLLPVVLPVILLAVVVFSGMTRYRRLLIQGLLIYIGLSCMWLWRTGGLVQWININPDSGIRSMAGWLILALAPLALAPLALHWNRHR